MLVKLVKKENVRQSTALGFTLVELLVVIAIIAVLSITGIVLFTNVQKNARDTKRRGDLKAISRAFEQKYNGRYQDVAAGDFTGGSIPADSRGNPYFRFVSANGYKVCAALDASQNQICNTPSATCVCEFSQQGTIGTDEADLPNSGYGSNLIGIGGSEGGTCDNLMSSSTYNSSSVAGWGPQTSTSHVGVSTDSRFSGNVLKFYSDSSGTSSDRVFASAPGAQTRQFLQNYTYKITFNYTATSSFRLHARDALITTVPANTGNARSYSYNFTDSFKNGCNRPEPFPKGSCYLLIWLPTPGMAVNIQNLSISESCV